MRHQDPAVILPEKDDASPLASGSDTEREDNSNELDPRQIVYLYLTFATPLPQPVDLSVIENVPSPDLSPYGDPFDWSSSRKNMMIGLCCISTLLTAYCAGMYAPAVEQMMAEWGISRVVAYVGITVFTAGEFYNITNMVNVW